MSADQEELLLDSPAARPCTHTRARHEHGTVDAYSADKCRCAPCTAANTAYTSNRRRQIAYGRWQAYVDAVPVRAHLERLLQQGIGWRAIAERAHVSNDTVRRILYGYPRRNIPPSNRVTARTAAALLAVTSGRVRATETPHLLTKET